MEHDGERALTLVAPKENNDANLTDNLAARNVMGTHEEQVGSIVNQFWTRTEALATSYANLPVAARAASLCTD